MQETWKVGQHALVLCRLRYTVQSETPECAGNNNWVGKSRCKGIKLRGQ